MAEPLTFDKSEAEKTNKYKQLLGVKRTARGMSAPAVETRMKTGAI